jgi:hypothetical protein
MAISRYNEHSRKEKPHHGWEGVRREAGVAAAGGF